MQIPRIDPPQPLFSEPLTRVKADERASVTSPATAAHLNPVGNGVPNQGRDPTLDPQRQRREREERSMDERKRRDQARRPAVARQASPQETPVPVEALERAVTGKSSFPPPPSGLDLNARALDLIAQWGRERIASADLDAEGSPVTPSPSSVASAHVHDPVDCAFCKGLMRAYKSTP